jgi:transcriptional regulator with XRE-family HTH domain
MRNQTLEFMQANFGKTSAYYYWTLRGLHDREVRANPDPEIGRLRKNVLRRTVRIRNYGRRAAAADREGVAVLRRKADAGKNFHAARRVLAHHVRRLRVARQMSQEDLADAAELSQDQISEIENAKHSTTLGNIQRLAFAFGVTVADLLREAQLIEAFAGARLAPLISWNTWRLFAIDIIKEARSSSESYVCASS